MDSHTFKFGLGDVVKDWVTSFEGVIEARTQWLNGCVRYAVQPQKLAKEGKPIDSLWFDENQLALVKEHRPAPSSSSGGPQRDPTSSRT